MSGKERDRLKVMGQLAAGLLGTAQTAERLGLSQRQIQRLLRSYRSQGDGALVHGLRGRRPNNAITPPRRRRAMELVAAHYKDYGPTLAAEVLAEEAGLAVSRETMRQWMMAEKLWTGARRGRRHRRRRPRRRCFGELVQMDTSEHDWLEGRGPTLVLLTMIDDATGRKLSRFYPADTTEANMELIASWIARWGRPVALYTDWASHFKQPQGRGRRPTQTQIQRALAQLAIELIAAHSPQAKGRVERSHRTDQDRLIKGLRREGARTLEQANDYLERVHLPKMEAKFAGSAADPADAHRSAEGFDLEAILCVQETRRVQNDWTVSIDAQAWQIEAGERTAGLRARRVIVERRRQGGLRLRYGDRYLKFHKAAGALEKKLKKKAVDLPAYGQIPPAAQAAICPQALNNSPARQGSPASYSQIHSRDEETLIQMNEEEKDIKKPVRIPNRTRKPSPDHPWRRRHF